MDLPPNPLKAALAAGRLQLGLWASLASNTTTEIIAGSGYDWLLLDMEHSPNDLLSILGQLQAVAPYASEPAVRLVRFETALMKQYLDLGVRSFLLPNVESADEARAIVAATRYAPRGVRGVAGQQRGNRWGRVPGYHANADAQICLMLQIETPVGVAHAQEIAAVDGVDGLFVGPNDLAASMGHMLQPNAPDVQAAIAEVLHKTVAAGKAPGILAVVEADAQRYIAQGFKMVGIGNDQGLLVKAADDLLARFRPPAAPSI